MGDALEPFHKHVVATKFGFDLGSGSFSEADTRTIRRAHALQPVSTVQSEYSLPIVVQPVPDAITRGWNNEWLNS